MKTTDTKPDSFHPTSEYAEQAALESGRHARRMLALNPVRNIQHQLKEAVAEAEWQAWVGA